MSKKLIGVKSSKDEGYVYVPYIHLETITFPDIKFVGVKEGKNTYTKIKKDDDS